MVARPSYRECKNCITLTVQLHLVIQIIFSILVSSVEGTNDY